MVESVPAPLQVVLWPLAGALAILVLRRVLPNWLRRTVALAAVLASLSALWSLRTGLAEPVTVSWEPLNFFRTSPILRPTSLGLYSGAIMGLVAAAFALGIRGKKSQDTPWHGVLLIATAGSLLVTLSGNLLTLAMGSGLLDLALVMAVILCGRDSGRAAWRMVVPGAASTLLLLISAVQMDAQVGSTSLLARDFPAEILLLVSVAGLLRLLVFPLHVRGLQAAEDAAMLLVPMGTGIYFLARAQMIGPAMASRPWMLAAGGVALLAGGILAWSSTIARSGMAATWSGAAIHQAGLALIFVLLVRPAVPWPWASLALALGALTTWWASSEATERGAQPRWFEHLAEWSLPLREQAKAAIVARTPSLDRWRGSWPAQRVSRGLAAIPVLSLTGLPWTAGALARWRFYGALLGNGEGGLLIAAMTGDALLAAGLWTRLGEAERSPSPPRLKLGPVLAMLLFSLLLLAIGLAPGRMTAGLGINPPPQPDVSIWGLGLVYVLPWLFGAWLARLGERLKRPAQSLEDVVQLEWLYRAAGRISRGLSGTVYWIGTVGEGEGWWGWALIVLALGALFFAVR